MNLSRFARGVLCLAILATSQMPDGISAQTAEDRARGLYKNGLENLQKNRAKEAINDFDEVLKLYRTTSVADDALLAKAQYQFMIGELDAARRTATELLQLNEGGSDLVPMATVLLGRLAVARQRTPESVNAALGSFDRVSNVYPRSDALPAALYYSGETQRLVGRNAEALEAYETVTEEFPRSDWAAKALIGRATILVRTGRAPDAMELLQRVRLRFPGTHEADLALSRITLLYRLHVVPTLGFSAYSLSNRKLGGAVGTFKGVAAIGFVPGQGIVVVNATGLHAFDGNGNATASRTYPEPVGVCLTPDGRTVAVGRGWLRPEAGPPILLGTTKNDGTNRPLEQIRAAAVLSSGEYLVSDADARAVMRFSPDGKHLGFFGEARADRLAVDDLDHVVMIERGTPVVIIAGPDGRMLKRIETRGAKNELRNPVDVAVDAFGHIYVLDRDLGGVFVFTPQGQPVTTFSIPEKAPGAFRRATAMAADDSGRLYIADERLQLVQMYQ